jgi:hypothetical protein
MEFCVILTVPCEVNNVIFILQKKNLAQIGQMLPCGTETSNSKSECGLFILYPWGLVRGISEWTPFLLSD